jgi:hypothetical protein
MPHSHHHAVTPAGPRQDHGAVTALSDILFAGLADPAQAMAGIVQAQQMRVLLGPELHGFAAPLQQAGLRVETVEAVVLARDLGALTQAELARVATGAALRELPRAEGQPTDLVDLALDLGAASAQPIARLDLLAVPGGWDSRSRLKGIAPLARQMNRHILAVQGGACLLAPTMLALLEKLRDFDDTAVSYLVTGFLRVMAGGSPTPVEATALRIAGLSEMPVAYPRKTNVTFNEVAQGVLDDLGLGQELLAAAPATEQAVAAPVVPLRAVPDLIPFARLSLLERDYAVAEDDDSGLLWFRPMEGGTAEDWTVLDSRTVDGWSVVATEVLGKMLDIQRAFAMMHVIRRRDIATEEVAEIYDLHGLIWWLRQGEAGPEARLDGGDWAVYPAPAQSEVKARAIDVLFHLVPDLSDQLKDKARDWAHRMAQTVQVSPIMMQAAE